MTSNLARVYPFQVELRDSHTELHADSKLRPSRSGRSRSSGSAVAIGDVEVITVPTARFSEFLDAHPRAQRVLLQLLAERLRGATRRHLEFGTSDALGRVCARVDEMARRYGRTSDEGLVIESPISQAELANWAGLSREAVLSRPCVLCAHSGGSRAGETRSSCMISSRSGLALRLDCCV